LLSVEQGRLCWHFKIEWQILSDRNRVGDE